MTALHVIDWILILGYFALVFGIAWRAYYQGGDGRFCLELDWVDPLTLAKGTPGFSGADLENLVNEAALLAAKQDKERVAMVDFEEAKDKVYMGLERKSKVISEEDKKTTAYHEAGHALVARFLPHTDAVNKVTIIPRGRAAGVTWFLPEERDFKYKDQLQSELSVAYGGRVAEELIFDRISTGAAGDIKQATDLAERMVRSWGMSDLGPLSYAKGEEQIFLGREIAQHRDFSEETARRIDNEIAKFINGAYENAKAVLKENIDILHRLAEVLLEKETVMGDELDRLILELRPGFDFPSKHDHAAPPEQEEGEQATSSAGASEAQDPKDVSDTDAANDTPEREDE